MAGISKRQWLLILMAVASVLLINGIGMLQDFRLYELRAEIPEFNQQNDLWGCNDRNYPWQKIIIEAMAITILLGMLAWLVIYVSSGALFQRLALILKYGSELLIAIFVGLVFVAVSISFSDSWVYDFWCGPLYGLLRSSYVYHWSIRVVFPVTVLSIFWAMCLSNQQMEKAT